MEAFEKLKETKALLDQGVITEEEYQQIKSRLLDEMINTPSTKEKSYAAPQVSEPFAKEEPYVAPQATAPITKPNPIPSTPMNEGASTGMKVLSFLFPIV